jgi:microsomal epoxide hydrolase
MLRPRAIVIFPVLLVAAIGLKMAAAQASDLQSIRESETTLDSGIHIHCLQAGEASSTKAIVFIPGWRLPAYLWRDQLKTFGPMARSIAIDPRSQGESTKTLEGNSPENRAKDLDELLRKLGVTKVVLVGWSQGAQDVSAYLERFGNSSVAAVVLVDSPVSIGSAEIEEHKEFSKAILASAARYSKSPEEFSRAGVRSLFRQPHPELDLDKITASSLRTPTDTGLAMLIMDIFGADRRPALSKFHKPALVIASAASPLLEQQKEMASGMPGATFLSVEGAGHALFVDQPEKFNDALRGFLQSIKGW